jgi:hypothetical protein
MQYQNSLDYFLFGPGQGSILWLICFALIFTSLSTTAPAMWLRSIDKKVESRGVGTAFVDDTGLGCNQHSTPHGETDDALFSLLQTLAQGWERLLYSTGGALNLQKCFWFVLAWRWTNGNASLHSKKTLPGAIEMTSGGNLQ